jgi:predicted metal-binding membrane protein
MDAMPMPGAGTMSMAWMPLCGQSWVGSTASFLTTWTVMMAAMMLPSSIPMLWRYRQAVGGSGQWAGALLPALAAIGYALVWIVVGAAVYPLGAAVMDVTLRHSVLAQSAPFASGLVVLTAGALQFTRWKARQLACWRSECRGPAGPGPALPRGVWPALRHGLRFGLHCSQCCAGLTAALLVTGIMDIPAMFAVTAGITLERLAPAGEHVARCIGVVAIGAGMLLIVRAAGLA